MRKQSIFKKSIISLTITFFLLGAITLPVHAASAEDILQKSYLLETVAYFKNKITQATQTIARTTLDQVVGFAIGSTSEALFGVNADTLGVCAGNQFVEWSKRDDLNNPAIQNSIDQLFTPEEQGSLPIDAETVGCSTMYERTTALGPGSGSMVAFAQRAQEIVAIEPVSVNLAQYFRYQAAKIPYVNQTAYAQTDYNAWGLGMILSFWETSRNVAYAIMSVMMLVIGMMIISRKKISPQLSVTVQTALPRVIISLVLITFSYPIGATLASMVVFLNKVIVSLFFGTSLFDNVLSGNYFDYLNLIAYIIPLTSTLGSGMGFFILFAAIMLIGASALGFLVLILKMMMVNFKILLQIIVAPISFAFAAIPGQEGLITEWFKKMMALVLAIPAMWFFFVASWYILLQPFVNPAGFGPQFTEPGFLAVAPIFLDIPNMGLVTMAMLPVISLMTVFYGTKADKALQEFILGAGGKKKR